MNNQKQRIFTIINVLKSAYADAKIVLHYSNPWELLVAVILSAQCTDMIVNKATEKLFATYKTLDDYTNAELDKFEQDIKSTGFYHNKAKNILASAKIIKDKFGGLVPKTMDEMLLLPGVARKTANVVLGNVYGVVEGIAVDTHVLRLSQRLRLVDINNIGGKKTVFIQKRELKFATTTKNSDRSSRLQPAPFVDYIKDADPVKIEKQLMEVIPKEDWFMLTYLLIDHGREVCKAQKPKCSDCVLREACPVSRI